MDGAGLRKSRPPLELAAGHIDAVHSRRDRVPRPRASGMDRDFGTVVRMTSPSVRNPSALPLSLLSVVIPARDEEESLPSTLQGIFAAFVARGIPHEIVVVDDGSRDRT